MLMLMLMLMLLMSMLMIITRWQAAEHCWTSLTETSSRALLRKYFTWVILRIMLLIIYPKQTQKLKIEANFKAFSQTLAIQHGGGFIESLFITNKHINQKRVVLSFHMSSNTLNQNGCICFFSSVCFHMCPQMNCLRWCIVTQVAFVCFFSSVCFHMCPQMTCLRWCI